MNHCSCWLHQLPVMWLQLDPSSDRNSHMAHPMNQTEHFPGQKLYFSCSSTNTITSLFKYNTYIGQHQGWTRKSPSWYPPWKSQDPAILQQPQVKKSHILLWQFLVSLWKRTFFLFQDKDQIEVPRLWKAPAWHPQLFFVKEPTVQSQSLSRCNQTAAKFCMQKLPLKWS